MIKIEDKQVNKIMINGKEVLKVVLNGATKYQKNTIQWSCPFDGTITSWITTSTSWTTNDTTYPGIYIFINSTIGGNSSSSGRMRYVRNGSVYYFTYSNIIIFDTVHGNIYFPYNGQIYYYDNISGVGYRAPSGGRVQCHFIDGDNTGINCNISQVDKLLQSTGQINPLDYVTPLQNNKLFVAIAYTDANHAMTNNSANSVLKPVSTGSMLIGYAQPLPIPVEGRIRITTCQQETYQSSGVRTESYDALISEIPNFFPTQLTYGGTSSTLTNMIVFTID